MNGKRNRKMTPKEEAQNFLMGYLQMAFDQELTDDQREIMSKQFARVEKLFGYIPNSFQRGS